MNAYTVADTAEVRRRIETDLDTIQRTVAHGDPRLKALVLTGGFARGEGAVLDGRPQNDYDLIAVRGLGRSRDYAEMAKELEEELGLHIDLAPVWAPRLRVASRSIFWYETALRGRVVWGDLTVLRRIRVRRVDQLDREEGMRLLANRAAGLLLAAGPTQRDRRIQASKALLGAMDVHLLALGRFPPSQRERWQAYQRLRDEGRLPPILTDREQHLAWAYAFKTDPGGAPSMPAEEAWNEAKEAVMDAVPVALRHAGVRDLDAYGRSDAWTERVYYWLKARRLGTRPWVFHPSSRVRVATLRMLSGEPDRRGGVERLAPDRPPLEALSVLRQATLQ